MPSELPISSRGIWESSDKGWPAPSPKGLPGCSSTPRVVFGRRSCPWLWHSLETIPYKNEWTKSWTPRHHLLCFLRGLTVVSMPQTLPCVMFLKSYLWLQGREACTLFHSACVESREERGVSALLLLFIWILGIELTSSGLNGNHFASEPSCRPYQEFFTTEKIFSKSTDL